MARRRTKRGARPFSTYALNAACYPHAQYGVDLEKVPDTYIEPFTAYRAWNWTEAGITSLNNKEVWKPKVAFEATTSQCGKDHQVPDPSCTCGMYAGINMKHLIDIDYIGRGVHGEVSLWGRLYRHTLGWRAQFAYPKFFIVPMNMIHFEIQEAKKRLDLLTEFGVEIRLQPEREAQMGQETFSLWMPDFGYSQQGLSMLVEKRAKWYGNKNHEPLRVGERITVYSDLNGGGIGVVKDIVGDDVFYNLFNPNVIYRKHVREIRWDERNWRWETTGLGASRGIR
jgi:hypothetical protein